MQQNQFCESIARQRLAIKISIPLKDFAHAACEFSLRIDCLEAYDRLIVSIERRLLSVKLYAFRIFQTHEYAVVYISDIRANLENAFFTYQIYLIRINKSLLFYFAL